jgi:hypothetical protein
MTAGRALAAVVLIHLAISLVHGGAHAGAQVPLPFASALFVYTVVLAAPIAGLAVSRWHPRAGALVVAASMGGALVFGLVNHFIVDGQDHVVNVAAGWRMLFGVTAALLLVSEAAGTATGVWAAVGSRRGQTLRSDLEVRP